MFTTRSSKLALSVGLIVVILVALFALGTTSVAKESHIASAGIGDLRHFEALQPAPAYEAPVSAPAYTGMGDWRRFEVEQEREALVSNSSYAGMGDLKHFEAQPSVLVNEALGNIHSYAGIGDQRRLEAEAARWAAQAEYYAKLAPGGSENQAHLNLIRLIGAGRYTGEALLEFERTGNRAALPACITTETLAVLPETIGNNRWKEFVPVCGQ